MEQLILVLNHHHDDLDAVLTAVRRRGFTVVETRSVVETHRMLAKLRPTVIVLNPLMLQPTSVEFELIEPLQQGDEPLPVLLLLESADATRLIAHGVVPLADLDFLTKPFATEEVLFRLDLLLLARERQLRVRRRALELEGQVREDFKTGLINDRHFRTVQENEFKRAQRHHETLSLLLVDVDEFKTVNDTTEYAFGDEVLVHVARCMKQTIRTTDHAARFGGDEFAILLPHTNPTEAVHTANRVSQAISGNPVQNGRYAKQVTVSIGIATFDGRTRGSLDELRRQANMALHQAKRRGKNQVWLFSETDHSEREQANGS
ncbi:MAG: GGDEF domain-containing protein [Planctomycetes bacterium]|nr:GGDEF domain-containing protein [Planctomycetota bacterium]MCB9888816.1 GGDEF domain-containing protein [Planctomycetota bacterium]